jgi:hypothetical protein
LDLSDEFPFPVEVSIKDKMEAGSNENATYVQLERRSQKIEVSSNSPAEFQFTTNPVPEPTGGGKVILSKQLSTIRRQTSLQKRILSLLSITLRFLQHRKCDAFLK